MLAFSIFEKFKKQRRLTHNLIHDLTPEIAKEQIIVRWSRSNTTTV